MKSILERSIAIIFSLVLFLVLLFSSLQIIVYNMDYYKYQYEKRNISYNTGINKEDLMNITNTLLEYLKDNRDNLNIQATINGEYEDVFGEREKAHMVDVKYLFVISTMIRNFGVIFLFAIMLYFLFNKQLLIKIFGYIKYVFLSIIGLLLILSGLFYLNFNKYFTIFHKIFFRNDLWLLDPKEDILVNIVPEEFFFETVIIVFGIFITMSIILIIILELIRKNLVNKYDY